MLQGPAGTIPSRKRHMILGLAPARLLRLYLAAAVTLGAGAYVGGAVTADICAAYDLGTIAGRSPALLCV